MLEELSVLEKDLECEIDGATALEQAHGVVQVDLVRGGDEHPGLFAIDFEHDRNLAADTGIQPDVFLASAKEGRGVPEILEAIVARLESAENRVKLRTLLASERVDEALERLAKAVHTQDASYLDVIHEHDSEDRKSTRLNSSH